MDPHEKLVAEFTSEIIELMREAAEETGGPCSKLVGKMDSLRTKISEKVCEMSQYFSTKNTTPQRGTKRTSSGTFKTGEGCLMEDGKVDDVFISDISPIPNQPIFSLDGDDSFNSKKENSESDLSLSGLLDDEDIALTHSPVAKKKKLSARPKHLTPTGTGFAIPAPKKRSVQRRTPASPVELNILDSMTNVDISDYDSSDEGTESESLAPSWARKEKVLESVKTQLKTDPDSVFGRVSGGSMCDLSKIFEGFTPNPEKYNKRRTMSGNWTLDRLQLEEEEDYREKMEYDKMGPMIIPAGAVLDSSPDPSSPILT